MNLFCPKLEIIPEQIGDLKNLETLFIHQGKIRNLPSSIAKLGKLKDINLYQLDLGEIPSAIFNCSSLKRLNIHGCKIKEISSDINCLSNIEELMITYSMLEYLPPQIGNLKNLTSLDLYNNNLKSLPLEISNLRKLTSLRLNNNPFDDMPGIKNMGIDELFEYFNKLRGIGNHTFIWELPLPVRTAFQQYLNFFSDFFEKAKGVTLNVEVLKIEEGLRINIWTSEEASIEEVNEYLKIYMQCAREGVENTFQSEFNNFQSELLKLKLEMQVNHLQQQLKQAEFENKYLQTIVDKFLDIQFCFVQSNLPPWGSGHPQLNQGTNIQEKIKKLIANNEIAKAIELILKNIPSKDSKPYNDVILLYSRYNKVDMETKIGILDENTKQIELNKINQSLLHMADLIE